MTGEKSIRVWRWVMIPFLITGMGEGSLELALAHRLDDHPIVRITIVVIAVVVLMWVYPRKERW